MAAAAAVQPSPFAGLHSNGKFASWHPDNEKMQMYTLGFLQSADLMRPSGNEHSSAYRQFPVDAFVGFLSSVKSMLSVDIQKQTVRGHMKRVHRLDRLASIPAMCHKKQFASQRHSCNLASFQRNTTSEYMY